jgi:hypothetical protein
MAEQNQISGAAMIEATGWGKAPFHGSKAHLYELIDADSIGKFGRERFWLAACGAEAFTHDKAPMFSAGSWSRCKKCERSVNHG